MGSDIFEITINLIKLLVIFLIMVSLVPMLVWLERRGSAFIQNRLGPNRVGPFGLTQLVADAIKFIFKEEFCPDKSVRIIYYMAPLIAIIPAALAMGSIPFSTPIEVAPFEFIGHHWGPYKFFMQSFQMPSGIIYILAVSSLGVYTLMMAGWSSGNKYSLLGAMRASAQMISYELALGLAIVACILIYGSFRLEDMIAFQDGLLSFHFLSYEVNTFLPNWGIFYQPIGALIFLTAIFAEANRLPFDLAEAESELVAGFHTEYGGFKMLIFFMGEYGHMMVASALLTIFYFGGYNIPWIQAHTIVNFVSSLLTNSTLISVVVSLIFLTVFLLKMFFFIWFYMWVRWTLPRFRYDQLMNLGWKKMLPWAIGNTIVTAIIIFIANIK